jgi:uncharacterized protein (UPF0264 family)
VRTKQPTRLLVSVRSAAEAEAALRGGCDLLDVKEPARGSLGAADPEAVAAVCEVVESAGSPVPVSVALGELSEWEEGQTTWSAPARVAFAKVGLSGCGRSRDWPRRWRNLRARFDDAAQRPLDWVAVLYADAAAGGPEPSLLIDLAATTGCRGVLVDTFRKDTGRLFDHVSPEKLTAWRQAAAEAGLMFAVAGGLRAEDLPRLAGVGPDLVAIRGAACRADRTSEVCGQAVRRFRSAMSAWMDIDS